MALKVTQVRSAIRVQKEHRGTLKSLGLGRIGRSRVHQDSPSLQGSCTRSVTSSRSRRSRE